jgi:mannose-6-phosphate isomerase-like protein (cupin superfamily)
MIVRGRELAPFDFEGLSIIEYTRGLENPSSSFAVIEVPAGVRHREARSHRCDKLYYLLAGTIEFSLDGERFVLNERDVCIVPRGHRFAYRNGSPEAARLILVHTPKFDLEAEEFLE